MRKNDLCLMLIIYRKTKYMCIYIAGNELVARVVIDT